MSCLTLVLTLVTLVGCKPASAPPPPPAPALTWTGNGNPGVSECSATVTVWCLTGYRLTNTRGLSVPLLLAQQRYATPETDTYQLSVAAVDGTGHAVLSPPATVTVH